MSGDYLERLAEYVGHLEETVTKYGAGADEYVVTLNLNHDEGGARNALHLADLRAALDELERLRAVAQADDDSAAGRIAYWLDCWQTYGAELGLPDSTEYIAGPPPSAEPRASVADFVAVLTTLGAVLTTCANATVELERLRARTREEIERRSYAVTHAKVCEEKCDKAHAELERLRAREQQYRAWLDGLGYDALWVDARLNFTPQQSEPPVVNDAPPECPVCGRTDVTLTKVGRMRSHSGDIWIGGFRQICKGVGELPKRTAPQQPERGGKA